MKCNNVKDEIKDAVEKLQLEPVEFRELPDAEARHVFDLALSTFCSGVDRRWWWEGFTKKYTAAQFNNEKAFEYITELVPNPYEQVWFIAEDVTLPFYPVYEATPVAARAVIGECYGFEYYLIAKDMRWLLCENHHDTLFAIGQEIEEQLTKLDA